MLELMNVSEYLGVNKDKLRLHEFGRTFKALKAVISRGPTSKKRRRNVPHSTPSKRIIPSIPSNTASSPPVRPESSDSTSTARSGATAESKNEESPKNLLNDFVDDVLDFLGGEATQLKWSLSPYYVGLEKLYATLLQD
jgi:hypothetical protein